MLKKLIEKITGKQKTTLTKEARINIKGNLGEIRQEIRLDRLDRDYYKTLNDIIIPSKKSTTQIDHLIISNYGIFVIENKNFIGNIYGRQNDKVWTQVIANQKNTFYNPVLQNYGHIKSLEEIIGKVGSIYSIIVFGDKSILRKIEINNQEIKVINEGKLLETIKSFDKLVFTDNEVKSYYNKVLESMSKIHQDRTMHVKNIKEKLYNQVKVCPRCNGELVTKKGKYGNFLGCENYPKCKYTYKLPKSHQTSNRER